MSAAAPLALSPSPPASTGPRWLSYLCVVILDDIERSFWFGFCRKGPQDTEMLPVVVVSYGSYLRYRTTERGSTGSKIPSTHASGNLGRYCFTGLFLQSPFGFLRARQISPLLPPLDVGPPPPPRSIPVQLVEPLRSYYPLGRCFTRCLGKAPGTRDSVAELGRTGTGPSQCS